MREQSAGSHRVGHGWVTEQPPQQVLCSGIWSGKKDLTGLWGFSWLFLFSGHTLSLWDLSSPKQGLNPYPLAVEAWNLNHWTAREVPRLLLNTF